MDNCQPDTPAFSESPSPCSKDLTLSSSDTPRLDHESIIDGKPWNIKHFFDKVDGNGYKCRICGQTKKHVRNHFLKHYPEHHECPLCRRTYTRKDNLNSHLKRDHQRVKASSGRFSPLKRRGLKEHPALKCFTPDVYSHVNYPPPVLSLMRAGSTAALAPQPSQLASPIDLSIRSTSAPHLHNPHAHGAVPPFAYDILPSFYNYFRH